MLRALVSRSRPAAPPEPAALALTGDARDRTADDRTTSRLVDAVGALVQLVGAFAGDADAHGAAETRRAADAWRRHLAFGAARPAEGDEHPGAGVPGGGVAARDWEGAVRFATARRRAEHAHAARALGELRDAVGHLVHGLHAVVQHEAAADDEGDAALRRVREAVADPDPDAVRRAARAAALELGALAERRARRREAEVAQLGRQLADLDAALDHARREGATDPLTGLGNRRALDEALAGACAAHGLWRRPAALVLFDVDGLKQVNDRHGHPAGDDALAAVAAQLARVFLRRGDVLVRHGGDEFAAVLPDASAADAERLARRAVAGVAAAAAVLDARWAESGGAGGASVAPFGVSAGVAAPGAREAPAAWLARADAALYAAKRAGKGTVAAAPAP